MSTPRTPEPFELAAYAVGQAMARPVPVVEVHRREVHLPDGTVLVEEFVTERYERLESALPQTHPSTTPPRRR